MDAERLRVRIRGHAAAQATAVPIAVASIARQPTPVDDCHSCGEVSCHRHVGPSPNRERRVWWLPPGWPEFSRYCATQRAEGDRLYGGDAEALPTHRGWRRWQEAVLWRVHRWRGRPLPQIAAATAAREARQLARSLAPEDTHVVVPQTLLPHLWRAGVLAGRRFDVLMTALPMRALQARLDAAATAHPQCRSLGDFRAEAEWVDAEAEALAAARHWISPHAQICALAPHQAIALPWCLPTATSPARDAGAPPRVLLPASALARKGVFELLAALREQAVEIVLPPGDSEPVLDAGIATVRRAQSYREALEWADVVALPAWVEHKPRGVLAAIAAGLPVIATSACGLPADLPWQRVEPGDVAGLRAALVQALARVGEHERARAPA